MPHSTGDAALEIRTRASHPLIEFRCCDCDKGFVNSLALRHHLRDKIHGVPKNVTKKKPHCGKCDRSFKNEKALQQHTDSVVHRPISNIGCLAGKFGCEARFTSPSAMIHHLECGSCPSGFDRELLNSAIIKHDVDHIITSRAAQDLLSPTPSSFESLTPECWTPSTDTETGGALLTPSSGQLSAPSFFNTSMTVNLNKVTSLRCPLCPPGHRAFKTQQGLWSHIASPAHALKIFNCPLVILAPGSKKKKGHKKTKHFSTLSGLAQHIEAGACRGGMSGLKATVVYLEEKLASMGLSVKLLC